MAAATDAACDSDRHISLKLVSEDRNKNGISYESSVNVIRFLTSEGASELELDMDELASLHYM
jgi:hypothetical protein